MNTPYPWQTEDAATLAAHPRWLLANEMRTGKTGAAILGALRVGAQRVGVVCPAIVTREWQRQLEDFGAADRAAWKITSYDKLVSRGAAGAGLTNLDALIVDECHYVKTPDAQRTIAIYGDGQSQPGLLATPYVWGLSGTPAPNHAGEYYTHLRAFGLTNLSRWQFLDRYCLITSTPFGYRVTGNRRDKLPELRDLLARMMSRRTQASVWASTPQPFWSVRTLTPTPADVKTLQEMDARMDPDRPGDLSKERRQLGLLKVPYVLAHVVDLLMQARVPKILIGAWHRDVIDHLHIALSRYEPITIVGDTSERWRWELLDRFQTAPACRVAIVQKKTGGVGISLSAATYVVDAEPDWTPGVDEQFYQRPQHIARRVPLPVDLIALAGSMDETILRTNVRKRKMNLEIILDAPASGEMAAPSLDDLRGVRPDAPIFTDDL